jgi:hypothetical protein
MLDKLFKISCFILLFVITISNTTSKELNKSFNKIIVDTNSDSYGKIIANDMRTLFDFKKYNPTLLEYVDLLYKFDQKINIIEQSNFKVKIMRNYIYEEVYGKFLISCIYLIEESRQELESCAYNKEVLGEIKLEMSKNLSVRSLKEIALLGEYEYIAKLNDKLLRSVFENYLNSKIAEGYLKIHLGLKEFTIDSTKIDLALNILNYNPEVDVIDSYAISYNKDETKYVNEKTFNYSYHEYSCETIISNQIFALMKSFGIKVDNKSDLQLIEYTKFPKLEYKTNCI